MLSMPDKDVVLIVDDVPENLAMLSDALDESGFVVLVATDGLSAIERLDHVTPDMILLDALMPGIDGFETCRRIKTLKNARDIPVVFMTGLIDTEHVLKGFQAGGIDYVTKPIKPAEVIMRIRTHIGNARMLAQVRNAIDAAEHAVIALGRGDTLLWQTSKSLPWLADYFGTGSSASSGFGGTPSSISTPGITGSAGSSGISGSAVLPPTVACWLAQQRDAVAAGTASGALTAIRDGKRLTIQLAAGERNGESLLLLEESRLPVPAPHPLDDCILTPRESDVLVWVAKGKTNRDIGDILGMSPRTVNKHLEHIYIKLGVETRSAAAALAVSRIT
jgi:DNA-binding NarL/FixJ family response regulator